MSGFDQALEELAAELGDALLDVRDKLPRHPTKRWQDWAARQSPADVLGCCVHHAASPAQDVRAHARYHTGPNHISKSGLPGLCYTFAIGTGWHGGRILLCNDLDAITWAQGSRAPGDENRHVLPILVLGDFRSAANPEGKPRPSDSQMERLGQLVRALQQVFGFDGEGIWGHYHFGKAACPGDHLRDWIELQRPEIEPRGAWWWQSALLRWDPGCLPRWGADGLWGTESKRALVRFEQAHKHRADGVRDPFTALLLERKYGA